MPGWSGDEGLFGGGTAESDMECFNGKEPVIGADILKESRRGVNVSQHRKRTTSLACEPCSTYDRSLMAKQELLGIQQSPGQVADRDRSLGLVGQPAGRHPLLLGGWRTTESGPVEIGDQDVDLRRGANQRSSARATRPAGFASLRRSLT